MPSILCLEISSSKYASSSHTSFTFYTTEHNSAMSSATLYQGLSFIQFPITRSLFLSETSPEAPFTFIFLVLFMTMSVFSKTAETFSTALFFLRPQQILLQNPYFYQHSLQGYLGFFCYAPQNSSSLHLIPNSKPLPRFYVFVTAAHHFLVPKSITFLGLL